MDDPAGLLPLVGSAGPAQRTVLIVDGTLPGNRNDCTAYAACGAAAATAGASSPA